MTRLLYFVLIVLISFGVLSACGQGEETEEDLETGAGTEEDKNESEEQGEAVEDSQDEKDETTVEDTEETEEVEETEEANEKESEETNASEETITETVTLYFSDEQLLETYKEQQEVEADSEEGIPAAALQAWINGPEHEELVGPFEGEEVQVQSVEVQDGTAEVSFSESLLDVNAGSSAEMAITEQIALTMEQFGYEETKILIEGEEESSLFGHMDSTEPISANNPDDYEAME
ncbi:GerMN domain-containing protein [Alteribacillus bidgolensis]|uniref:Sporulation and spore germination n=1 Tax=Alteribacillus bidgolensis TaxID=930129 RepID=A0A1G8ISU3_9BACI|nr:GerMN domain-containing protein [Alteribacillus bidgolensis]SDI21530.1 Sporulation and spore germination [Alteribacillus bidgolensis]